MAQVIIFAFHSEFMLHGYNENIANTMGMTLNIASLLTGVERLKWDYLSRRSERTRAAGWAPLQIYKEARGMLLYCMQIVRLAMLSGNIYSPAEILDPEPGLDAEHFVKTMADFGLPTQQADALRRQEHIWSEQ